MPPTAGNRLRASALPLLSVMMSVIRRTGADGENGLNVTRSWQGCQLIECYESGENANQITIWQKWDSQADHESYVKHRHEDGSFDFLGELIASPPEIVPLKPVNMKTDAQQIVSPTNMYSWICSWIANFFYLALRSQ